MSARYTTTTKIKEFTDKQLLDALAKELEAAYGCGCCSSFVLGFDKLLKEVGKRLRKAKAAR